MTLRKREPKLDLDNEEMGALPLAVLAAALDVSDDGVEGDAATVVAGRGERSLRRR